MDGWHIVETIYRWNHSAVWTVWLFALTASISPRVAALACFIVVTVFLITRALGWV